MGGAMRINLGCGIYLESGYVNIDFDPSVKPDIIRDIKRGLPFTSDTIEEIRAFHFLEHLDPNDFIFTLAEGWRVLVNGGIFDIQVPLGITDDPTHRVFFHENSFNVFLDPASQFNYRNGMNWTMLFKEVIAQKFQTLHITLKAVKGNHHDLP